MDKLRLDNKEEIKWDEIRLEDTKQNRLRLDDREERTKCDKMRWNEIRWEEKEWN